MKKLLTMLACGCTLLAGLYMSAKEDDKTYERDVVQGSIELGSDEWKEVASSHPELEDQTQEFVIVKGSITPGSDEWEELVSTNPELEAELRQARESLDEAARKLLEVERQLAASKDDLMRSYILQTQDELSSQLPPGSNVSVFPEMVASLARDPGKRQQAVYSLAHSAPSQGGFLGVWLESDENGVRIVQVTEDGPALQAGLQKDDIVTKVDKLELVRSHTNPITTMYEYIRFHSPGTEIELTYLRDGTEMKSTAILAEQPSEFGVGRVELDVQEPQMFERLRQRVNDVGRVYGANFWRGTGSCGPDGFWIADIEEDLGQYFDVEYGVLVLSTVEGSDLKNGDILLSIDEKPVRSVSHARRFIQAADGETMEISVKRRGREKQLNLSAEAVMEKYRRCG